MARRIASLHRMDAIPLAGGKPGGGGRLSRLLSRSAKGGEGSGSANLLVSAGGLLIEGHPAFGEKLEIPHGSIQRAIVDDGAGWAYTTATCRFPIFDRRSDGSGTGALVGPLWATSPSLVPAECPVLQLDPVPAQIPNIALIFEPGISVDAELTAAGGDAIGPVAMMILRAEDPDLAHELLSARLTTGSMGLEVLDYLRRPGFALPQAPADEASAASA